MLRKGNQAYRANHKTTVFTKKSLQKKTWQPLGPLGYM